MNLRDYMVSINEEAGKRGRPKKTDAQRAAELDGKKKKPIPQDQIEKKDIPVDVDALAPRKEDVWGKKASENGSLGKWDVDAPKPKEEYIPFDDDNMSENLEQLREKVSAKEDFFIQGEAGWGKTSLIVDMAGRYNNYVLTVYLDKAEAVDLGGTPFLEKDPDGTVHTAVAPPAWADLMWKNGGAKGDGLQFLLFFDEMNQAQTDVMQALMPIILKHSICGMKFKNFFVGSAGNKEDEAELNVLSGPLKSRLAPIIKWKNDWNQAFQYLHREWADKIGKEFVDEMQALAPEVFKNPREVEHKIFKSYSILKANKDFNYIKVDSIVRKIMNLSKYEDDWNAMPRPARDKVKKFAEHVWGWLRADGNEWGDSATKQNRRGRDMLPPALKAIIKQAVTEGYYDCEADGQKYGFSKENIMTVVDIWNGSKQSNGKPNEPINAEMLKRHINVILAEEGASWKYDKDSEWRRQGYLDPNKPDPEDDDYDEWMAAHPDDPDYAKWKKNH